MGYILSRLQHLTSTHSSIVHGHSTGSHGCQHAAHITFGVQNLHTPKPGSTSFLADLDLTGDPGKPTEPGSQHCFNLPDRGARRMSSKPTRKPSRCDCCPLAPWRRVERLLAV